MSVIYHIIKIKNKNHIIISIDIEQKLTSVSTKCSNYSIVPPTWGIRNVCFHPEALKEWNEVKTLFNFV